MNLLPVVLRLAGAEVSVYLIDQSEAFVEGFKRAWEPLNPEFLRPRTRRMRRFRTTTRCCWCTPYLTPRFWT